MFDNHLTNQELKIEVAFRDKYPTLELNIESFEIKDIIGLQSFKVNVCKEIVINNSFRFILHNNLLPIIQKGNYRIWYSREDHFDRFIEIVMTEKL